MALEGRPGVTLDFAAHREELAALEKELQKAEKGIPTTKVDLAAWRLAKEQYSAKELIRVNNAKRGAEKEVERIRKLKEICEEKIAAWGAVISKIDSDSDDRQLIWASRRTTLATRDSEVMKLFDDKISAAEAKDGVTAGPGAAFPPPSPAATATAELPPPAQLQAAVEQKAMTQLMWFANYAAEDVIDTKTLGTIKPAALPAFVKMHAWMSASAAGDQMIPYAFCDMCSSVELAMGLVGAKVWTAFFGETVVTDLDVCPYQLRVLVFQQLTTLSKQLAASEQVTAEAKTAFEAATATWVKKKARCSPYGA